MFWSWGSEQWSRSAVVGKPVVAGVGGAVKSMSSRPRGSLDLTELVGPVVAAILGGDVGTTILGEGCGLVPLMVGRGGVLGWWSPGMLFVARIGSVGHKWTPDTPAPLVPPVERSLVFQVVAPGSPVVETMQLVLAETYSAGATEH